MENCPSDSGGHQEQPLESPSHPIWLIPSNPQSSRLSSAGQSAIIAVVVVVVDVVVVDGFNWIHHGGPSKRSTELKYNNEYWWFLFENLGF